MQLPTDEIIVEIHTETAQLVYGSKEEEERLKEDFLLFTIGQYMKNIAIDIADNNDIALSLPCNCCHDCSTPQLCALSNKQRMA